MKSDRKAMTRFLDSFADELGKWAARSTVLAIIAIASAIFALPL